MDRLGVDGSLITERLIRPEREKSSIVLVACIRWNDGIALFGGVSGYPAATGWFAMLDTQLNLESEKFGDQYSSTHVMAAAAGSLFLINFSMTNPDGSRTSIIKLGPTGEVIARHAFSDRSFSFGVFVRRCRTTKGEHVVGARHGYRLGLRPLQ